jgi:hypothetical protein
MNLSDTTVRGGRSAVDCGSVPVDRDRRHVANNLTGLGRARRLCGQ